MDIGLMALTQHSNDRDPSVCMRELLEQARVASQRGLASLFVGEHHFTEDIYFDSFSTLARAAVEVRDDMHIGTSVCLLPLHHPTLVAERAATLDVITGGSFVLGAAAGYRDQEFEVLEREKAERAGRVVEGVEVIRKLWTTDDASYHGEHVSLDGVSSHPHPIQETGPPVWLGGTSPVAVRNAAALGDAWLIDPVSPLEKLEKATRLYDRELSVEPVCRPIRRDVYVAETTEEAVETAMPYLLDKYESLSEWGIIDDEDAALDERERFEAVREDRYVIGSPERVTEELETLNDRLGVDYVIARVQWPGMSHEHALDAIDLLGHDVVPRVATI